LVGKLGNRGTGPTFEELDFKRPQFEFEGESGAKRQRNEARALGTEHGRKGLPGPDQPEALQASAYSDKAEQILAQISREWHHVNSELRGHWCRLRHLHAERQKQVPAAETAVRKAQAKVDAKDRLYEKQRAAARSARPGTRHRIGRISYTIGLIAVFLVDVPLNAAVFQIFGENQLATWALAALLGILVVPAAHVLGTQIRNSFPDRVITAAATVVPLVLILAIAIIRTKYLEENNVDVGGALGVFLFLAFNLAVFASAVFLSYLRHDPYEQALEEAAAELKEARGELAVKEAALTRLQNELAAIRAKAAEIHAWGEEELQKAKDWAASERNFYEQLIDEYLTANQAARERPQDVIAAIERSMRKKPTIPPDLAADATLRWTCDGEPEAAHAGAQL
jgi:hypothetical protein